MQVDIKRRKRLPRQPFPTPGTEVLASQMNQEIFNFGDYGKGSAISVILLLAIIPVMIANIRRFREQESTCGEKLSYRQPLSYRD